MLTDLFILWLSNDMKIAVQKNHLGGLILYRSFDPSKNGVISVFILNYSSGRHLKANYFELEVHPKSVNFLSQVQPVGNPTWLNPEIFISFFPFPSSP